MATKIDERAAQSAQMSVSHEKIMQRLQDLYSSNDGGERPLPVVSWCCAGLNALL